MAVEPIEKLPLLAVEERSLGRPLLFCTIPGFEILSVFSVEQTRAIAEALQRQRALLSLVIPPGFQASDGLPQAIILDEQKPLKSEERIVAMRVAGLATAHARAASEREDGLSWLADSAAAEARRDLVAQGTEPMLTGVSTAAQRSVVQQSLEAVRGDAGPIGGRPSPPGDVLSIRNARAAAPDRIIFYVNIFGLASARPRSSFPAENQPALRTVLPVLGLWQARRPQLPGWIDEALGAGEGSQGIFARRAFGLTELRISPLPIAVVPVPGLSVEQALAERYLSRETATRHAIIRMFMTWALLDENPERANAFWRFVDYVTRQPATSAAFADFFGADGWEQFHRYWRDHTVTGRFSAGTSGPSDDVVDATFRLAKTPTILTPVIRRATRAESVRIRSEYEWRIGREFEAAAPELAAQCFEQAGRRLRAAYGDGERDPQFLATLALFEDDAGKAADALPRMEEAAATGVERPWLYARLGERRYAEERARLATPTGKFTREQVQRVLEPLRVGRRQRPALAGVFHLTAGVWARSVEAAGSDELAALAEGAALFPRDAVLAYKIALLHVQAGALREAAALADRALVWPEIEPALRTRLEKLASMAARGTKEPSAGVPLSAK